MNLILIGFKRCGKTTYGKSLAEKLGLPFIDTDYLIKESYGLSCQRLVKEQGIERFRTIESEVILSLKPGKRQIISLGAGAILSFKNQMHLKTLGHLLYLRLDKQTLFNRQMQPPLPYFIDPEDPVSSFETMYFQRISQYEKLASSTLDLEGKNPQEILCQLIDLVTSFASPHGENHMVKPSAL